MGGGRRSPLNLNALLAAVEAAPPVAAVDVLATALAEAVGAREVSFLIADFSGRSLIRLGHSGGTGTLRLQGQETAERVSKSVDALVKLVVGDPLGAALDGHESAAPVDDVAIDEMPGYVEAFGDAQRGCVHHGQEYRHTLRFLRRLVYRRP